MGSISWCTKSKQIIFSGGPDVRVNKAEFLLQKQQLTSLNKTHGKNTTHVSSMGVHHQCLKTLLISMNNVVEFHGVSREIR